MDPNETLNMIRAYCNDWELVGDNLVSQDDLASLLDNLVEHVIALDEWLANGGFHPNDWS